MHRAPLVLAGTAAGLAGVLAYHTTQTPRLLLTGVANGTPRGASHRAGGSHSTGAASSTTTGSTTTGTSTAGAGGGPGPAPIRTAVGRSISYPYGVLQVKVTKAGSRITHATVARLSVPDQQSGAIDQQAVPVLDTQVVSVQTANIDGVSGASFTSQAYRMSLQSALDKLR